jgi:hypothetical protein
MGARSPRKLTARYSNSPSDYYGVHNRPIEVHLTRQLKTNLPYLLPIQCCLPATTQASASSECTSHNRSHSKSINLISPPVDAKVNDKTAEPKIPKDDKKPRRTRSTRQKGREQQPGPCRGEGQGSSQPTSAPTSRRDQRIAARDESGWKEEERTEDRGEARNPMGHAQWAGLLAQ